MDSNFSCVGSFITLMTSGKWQRNVFIHNQCCTFQVMSTTSRQISLVTEMRGEVSFPSHPHSQTLQQCDRCTIERSSPLTPTDSSLSIPMLSRLYQEVATLTRAHGFLCWPSSVHVLPRPTCPFLWQKQVFRRPGANSSRSGSSEQVSYNRIRRTRLCLKLSISEHDGSKHHEWVWILSSINDIPGLNKVESSHYWLHFLFRLLVKHHFFHWGPPMHQRVSLCSAGRCRHRALVPGFTEGADQLTDPH